MLAVLIILGALIALAVGYFVIASLVGYMLASAVLYREDSDTGLYNLED